MNQNPGPHTPAQVVVYEHDPEMTSALEALLSRTGFPLVTEQEAASAPYSLHFRNRRLTLMDNTVQPAVAVGVDFLSGSVHHRMQFGGGLGQPVARAVNARKLKHTDAIICDATGGFGRDAFVFASLGCRVILLERSRVMYELLKNAIDLARLDTTLKETANRMQVYLSDSTGLPGNWPVSGAPHTIYLDPMYPASGKSAAAKKEMQTLKRLLKAPTDNHNDTALLKAAMHTAEHRVVVKRPKTAPPIEGFKATGEIKSANTRYDIYRSLVSSL